MTLSAVWAGTVPSRAEHLAQSTPLPQPTISNPKPEATDSTPGLSGATPSGTAAASKAPKPTISDPTPKATDVPIGSSGIGRGD